MAKTDTQISNRIKHLKHIADQYKINVTFNSDMQEDNTGGNAGDIIWLGKFDDMDLLTIAFFHELAHCESQAILIHRKYYSSRLADEGFAWEYGFDLAARHGYTWDIKHKVYKYAEQNLRSYIYQEKIEITNEEWLCRLSTEEKAEVLRDMVITDSYGFLDKIEYEEDWGCNGARVIAGWLKAVHKE